MVKGEWEWDRKRMKPRWAYLILMNVTGSISTCETSVCRIRHDFSQYFFWFFFSYIYWIPVVSHSFIDSMLKYQVHFITICHMNDPYFFFHLFHWKSFVSVNQHIWHSNSEQWKNSVQAKSQFINMNFNTFRAYCTHKYIRLDWK